ncbi:MAG: hypothetical protein AAF216_09410 [Pseudomonadota bacterium]
MFDINSPFTMVVFIVLIAVGAGVVNNWIKLRQEQGTNAEDSVEVDRLKAEVRELKSRVATLERLATDKDSSLREEISRLG